MGSPSQSYRASPEITEFVCTTSLIITVFTASMYNSFVADSQCVQLVSALHHVQLICQGGYN